VPCATTRCELGPMAGEVADLAITGPALPPPADVHLRPGFRLACEATFKRMPAGETTLICKTGEYWLRYDVRRGAPEGFFTFFVFLNGSWEPHAEVKMPVETGRVYRVSAGWDGLHTCLAVEGAVCDSPVSRTGLCRPAASPRFVAGNATVAVTNVILRNEPRVFVQLANLRTCELLPRLGATATLQGELENIGKALAGGTLEVRCREPGACVSPARQTFANLAEGARQALAWTVDPGTNDFVNLVFTVTEGTQKILDSAKRLVFLPAQDPDLSARAWQPPVKPVRTYYVDGTAGDDARDGLTPETAWKSFRQVAALTLGPGERLLLKRGSVFNEELRVAARGAAENWAEIGVYGTGMRPQIRRNRHINDRCGLIRSPSHLAVRDLVFCNAGLGLSIVCEKPGAGHILVERCLAHHIEGVYRFNSHGIPEWRDEKGAPGPGGSRSCGIFVGGDARGAHHLVVRDCESYQCSSGFHVSGVNTFVNRMFCHDNYAHNTSPHPYNCTSRSWMTDCVFDASGWHAAAGTMGVMLWDNCGWIVRGCHFLNQPDSGSPDQGGIDFEARGENCLVEECTFRNNAGAAIEVLGLRSPQTRNVRIHRCRFDRNNWAFKNGPAEIQVWGSPRSPTDVCCSNGLIDDNGYVTVPGVPFYVNETCTSNDWQLVGNRRFDFAEELDAAYPLGDPPRLGICGEVWTDEPTAALSVQVAGAPARLSWEQLEGPVGVTFAPPAAARTHASLPGPGDYRVNAKADDGRYWRTARTAVHVLPRGARTRAAWTFARNLDAEGWQAENTGTDYEHLLGKSSFWNSKSFPVHYVCGDYYVIAVKGSATAALVTPDDRDVGVQFAPATCNALRVKMQNHTDSARMRLSWQTSQDPTWSPAKSVAFAVTPQDADDAVYTVPLPAAGSIKRLRLSFSADGKPVTGTCRIDYIWLGILPR